MKVTERYATGFTDVRAVSATQVIDNPFEALARELSLKATCYAPCSDIITKVMLIDGELHYVAIDSAAFYKALERI